MSVSDIAIRLAIQEVGGEKAIDITNRFIAAIDRIPGAARQASAATQQLLSALPDKISAQPAESRQTYLEGELNAERLQALSVMEKMGLAEQRVADAMANVAALTSRAHGEDQARLELNTRLANLKSSLDDPNRKIGLINASERERVKETERQLAVKNRIIEAEQALATLTTSQRGTSRKLTEAQSELLVAKNMRAEQLELLGQHKLYLTALRDELTALEARNRLEASGTQAVRNLVGEKQATARTAQTDDTLNADLQLARVDRDILLMATERNVLQKDYAEAIRKTEAASAMAARMTGGEERAAAWDKVTQLEAESNELAAEERALADAINEALAIRVNLVRAANQAEATKGPVTSQEAAKEISREQILAAAQTTIAAKIGEVSAAKQVLAERERVLLAVQHNQITAEDERKKAIGDQRALEATKRRNKAAEDEMRVLATKLPEPVRSGTVKKIDELAESQHLKYLREKQKIEERVATTEKAAGESSGLITSAERQVELAKQIVAEKNQALAIAKQELASQSTATAEMAKASQAAKTDQATEQTRLREAKERIDQLKITDRLTRNLTDQEKTRRAAGVNINTIANHQTGILRNQVQAMTMLKNISASTNWAETASAKQILGGAQMAFQMALRTKDVKEKAAYNEVALALRELGLEKQITGEEQHQVDIQNKPLGGGMRGMLMAGPEDNQPVDMTSLSELNKGLSKTGEAGRKATKEMSSGMRDFAIELRSVGSIMAGTGWQGGLYYFSQIGRNMKGTALAGALTAFGIGLVAKALLDLIKTGVKLQGITQSFDNMTASSNVFGESLARSIQDASHGTITLADSMKTANVALLAGGDVFADKLPKLMEIARAAAVATGQDITYTYNSLITGIARGSPKLIDNANIYLKLGDANASYARQLGKSVTELTAQEKQIATANAVLAAGAEFIKRIGAEASTEAEEVASFGIAWKDMINQVSVTVNRDIGIANWIEKEARGLQAYNRVAEDQVRINALLKERGALMDALAGKQARYVSVLGMVFQFGENQKGTLPEDQAAALLAKRAALTKEVTAAEEAYGKELVASKTAADPLKVATAAYEKFNKVQQELLPKLAALNIEFLKAAGVPVPETLRKIAGETTGVAAATEEALSVSSEYLEKLQAISEKAPSKMATTLVDDVTKLRELMDELPEMPKLGDSLMTTNVKALKVWAIEADKLVDKLSTPFEDYPSTIVARMEEAQKKQIATKFWGAFIGGKAIWDDIAAAMGNGIKTFDDLIEKFDEVTPELQGQMKLWGIYREVMRRAFEQKLRPTTPIDFSKNITDAITQLEKWASELDAIGQHQAAAKLRGPDITQLKADTEAKFSELIALDAAGQAAWFANWSSGIGRMVEDQKAQQKELIDLRADLLSLPSTGLPVLPEIGKSILTTDIDGVIRFLEALRDLKPAESENATAALAVAQAQRESQAAFIATAKSMDDPNQALIYLAEHAYGAGAGLETLIDKFQEMPGVMQRAVTEIGLFDRALDKIMRQAAEPISVDMALEGVKDGLKDIDQLGTKLLKYADPKDVLNWSRTIRERFTADAKALFAAHKSMSAETFQTLLQDMLDYYTAAGNADLEYYKGAEQRAKDASKALKKTADETRTEIENALNRGLNVTGAQMLASVAGKYKDVPLENARRLDAIAERGFKELKANPDWATILRIPKEVLGAKEEELKAWAAQASEDLKSFTHPQSIDLIDWKAFGEAWDKNLKDKLTKKEVLDYALGQLELTGRLKGKSEEEAAKEVRKMLGLGEDEQSVTFATYFKEVDTGGDPFMNAVVEQVRNPGNYIEFLVKMNILPSEALDILKKNQENASKPLSAPSSGTYNPELYPNPFLTEKVSPTAYKNYMPGLISGASGGASEAAAKTAEIAGAAAIQAQAFVKGFSDSKVATAIATDLNKDFVANAPIFAQAGNAAGGVVASAFHDAVLGNVGDIRSDLANLLAPGVAEILNRGRGSRSQI